MSYTGAQAAAKVLTNVEWPEDVFPIDPVAIAVCYGITVSSDTDMVGTTSSGACVTDENGKIVILYNPSETSERIRFTIAHELGHALLHGKTVYKRINKSLKEYKKEEFEANDFAVNLLMPEQAVKIYCTSDDVSISSLSMVFGISQTTMRIRMQQLRLMNI